MSLDLGGFSDGRGVLRWDFGSSRRRASIETHGGGIRDAATRKKKREARVEFRAIGHNRATSNMRARPPALSTKCYMSVIWRNARCSMQACLRTCFILRTSSISSRRLLAVTSLVVAPAPPVADY